MLIVHVHVQVKPEFVAAFKEATIENARNSIKEPGIARFDVVQQQDDPARFVLVEVYRTPEAALDHKETDHYVRWRDAVARDDGRAALQREIHQRVSEHPGMVADALRIRHRDAHCLRRGRRPRGGRGSPGHGRRARCW